MHHASAEQTVGGKRGVILRRLIHVGMMIYPVIYLLYAKPLSAFFHLTVTQFMWALFAVIGLIELCRLRFGVLLFAQRKHERKHISSFAWGGLAMCIVLITLPDPRYALPIVATCALGDPLLSMLRARVSLFYSMIMAMGFLVLMWWVASIWLPMPLWLPILIASLTVWSEQPNLPWIDDNALMQLVPLVFVLLFV